MAQKRLDDTCNISSLNFSEGKDQENAFLENLDTVIRCNLALPVTINNNLVLKYAISPSLLFIDHLQMFH